MKRTLATWIGGALAVLAASAGDVQVVLDSTNGASAFRVLDADSNVVLDVESGANLRLGRVSLSHQLDQYQWEFFRETHINPPESVWQSFTAGLNGRLSRISWWNNNYEGNVDSGRIQIRAGEGPTGAILWSKDMTWNEYWPQIDVDSNLVVSAGEVFTIEVLATIETVRPGYAEGNPYPRGLSSEGPDIDFLFATYVSSLNTNMALVSVPSGNLGVGVEPTPTSERLTVAGNAVVTGSVAAASFAGNGGGLTDIGSVSLADGAVTTAKLAAGAVTSSKIAAGAVQSSHLATFAVTSNKITWGDVHAEALADGAVTAAKIAVGAVGTAALANDAVDASKIAPNAVGPTELNDGTVSSSKLASVSVGTAHLMGGAVTSGKIADNAVFAQHLVGEAVTTAKLGTFAVTADKIANDAVVTAKLTNGAVTAVKLANDAVTTAKLTNEVVTTEKLAANAVTAEKLADGACLAELADDDGSGSGLDADLLDGLHAGAFARIQAGGLIPSGTNVVIYPPHFIPFTLQIGCEWPHEGGVASLFGFENSNHISVTFQAYHGDGTSTNGGTEAQYGTAATLLNFGSGSCQYSLRCRGTGLTGLELSTAGSTLGAYYRLIY